MINFVFVVNIFVVDYVIFVMYIYWERLCDGVEKYKEFYLIVNENLLYKLSFLKLNDIEFVVVVVIMN